VSELLATLEAPVYIERVGLGDNKQIAQAARAIRRAVENQVKGLGFSLIEVLSPCPTIWKMTPVEAQHWVRDVMEKTFPLGVFCDRTKERSRGPACRAAPRSRSRIPEDSRRCREDCRKATRHGQQAAKQIDLRVRVAGFGGQGVCCWAKCWPRPDSMRAWRSRGCRRMGRRCARAPRTATCGFAPDHRFAAGDAPNVLVAMNEPSLRKFDKSVRRADGSSTTATRFRPIACAKTCMCWRSRSRNWPMSWATRAPATW
jgi:2-oxoisovalerate ferredoxin oxidoreductase beta subunit